MCVYVYVVYTCSEVENNWNWHHHHPSGLEGGGAIFSFSFI